MFLCCKNLAIFGDSDPLKSFGGFLQLTVASSTLPTPLWNVRINHWFKTIFFFISALYLIIVLAMGIMAVLMTIFVLRCHHSPEDKPIPNYLEKICKLAKKMFGIGCCCKRNTVLDLENDKMGKKGKIIDPVEAFEPELSWPEVTLILDKFFFKVYLSLMVTATTVVLLILVIHYYAQYWFITNTFILEFLLLFFILTSVQLTRFQKCIYSASSLRWLCMPNTI